ncbi:MAG: 30S ribosomal protein S27ae [Candidatus Aenigmarchaeota archaeon]|nr:30S ribosomal protein S27ae [Candidatus Aenigmarchaeota archaeon]
MKHQQIQQSKYFKISDGNVERLRKFCPRCGDSILAQHKGRQTCGKCSLTIIEGKQ